MDPIVEIDRRIAVRQSALDSIAHRQMSLAVGEENLPVLARRAGALHTHTATLSDFLRKSPGIYSHYVLLDHQDWLAWHEPAALAEEWELIFANSRPGTRILMRSAGLDLSFIPAAVRTRLRFFPERTEPLHRTDRVGTYGSLHFAEVI